MYGKDQWIAEHGRIGDEYAAGEIESSEARDRLKDLGFDWHEIDAGLETLWKDRRTTETAGDAREKAWERALTSPPDAVE